MKTGDLVVVLAKLDSRVRDKTSGLVLGTLDEIYGETVSVLLPGGDIWRGLRREIQLAKDQE
jgi:hypothetical protein